MNPTMCVRSCFLMAEEMDSLVGFPVNSWSPDSFESLPFLLTCFLNLQVPFPWPAIFDSRVGITPWRLHFPLHQEKSFQSLLPNTGKLPFLFVQKYLYFCDSFHLPDFSTTIFTLRISFNQDLSSATWSHLTCSLKLLSWTITVWRDGACPLST